MSRESVFNPSVLPEPPINNPGTGSTPIDHSWSTSAIR